MKTIAIAKDSGAFAGDKDAAAKIREKQIRPALRGGGDVILDFDSVEFATQSFIHALLAAVVRADPQILERMQFKNCNETVQSLVTIVVEYAQEELEA